MRSIFELQGSALLSISNIIDRKRSGARSARYSAVINVASCVEHMQSFERRPGLEGESNVYLYT